MELSSSNIKKFLIFQEMELSSSNIKKILIFPEMDLSSLYLSYISGGNFPSLKKKKKKKHSEKVSYILGNGTLQLLHFF